MAKSERPPKAKDWDPYHASPEAIAALEKAGIEPAQCWISTMVLANGERHDPGAAVAIWDVHQAAFRKAMRPHRPVSLVMDYFSRDKFDLATLKRKIDELGL